MKVMILGAGPTGLGAASVHDKSKSGFTIMIPVDNHV